MGTEKKKEPLFQVPEHARIDERLLGVHAVNAFANHDSSPRLAMLISHMAQNVVLNHADEKIVQTGIDHQLGQNTFSIRIEEDCQIKAVIERFRSIGSNHEPIEYYIIVQNSYTGEYDYYVIPFYFTLHQSFGFQYSYDREAINNLRIGSFLQKGQILADSPSVKENDGYAFGRTTNVCLITDPGTSEDGVIISESYAKAMSYNTFETRTISFGSDKLPLNIYGDDEVYKGFPDLGEFVNEDAVLAVLRSTKETVGFALTSKTDLKNFNHSCDMPIFVPRPGEMVEDIDGNKVKSGYIVDIKAYENFKSKRDSNFYPKTAGDIQKHVDAMKSFHNEIVDVYESIIKKELYSSDSKTKSKGPSVTPRLNKLIIESYAIGHPRTKQLPLTHKGIPLDRYMVTFTIKYVNKLRRGSKVSESHGMVLRFVS